MESIPHMSKSQSHKPHVRGFARNVYGRPAAAQERALLDAGASAVYVDGRGLENWHEFVRALKRGDVAAIEMAGALPHGPDGISSALSDLDKRGVVLRVENSGLRSDRNRAEIILAAWHEQKRHKHEWTSKTASRAAKRSHKNRAKPQRAPEAEARKIWFDTKRYNITADALIALQKIGWSKSACYNTMGRRWVDMNMGRPRKPKT